MKLAALLEQLLSENDLDKVTARQYARSLERFQAMLESPAEVSDLTALNIPRFPLNECKMQENLKAKLQAQIDELLAESP